MPGLATARDLFLNQNLIYRPVLIVSGDMSAWIYMDISVY